MVEASPRFRDWYGTLAPENEKLPLGEHIGLVAVCCESRVLSSLAYSWTTLNTEWAGLDRTPILKMLVVRCLRPDRTTVALTNFIRTVLPNGAWGEACSPSVYAQHPSSSSPLHQPTPTTTHGDEQGRPTRTATPRRARSRWWTSASRTPPRRRPCISSSPPAPTSSVSALCAVCGDGGGCFSPLPATASHHLPTTSFDSRHPGQAGRQVRLREGHHLPQRLHGPGTGACVVRGGWVRCGMGRTHNDCTHSNDHPHRTPWRWPA